MALTYFQIPANGSTIGFNAMEDFLSFAQLEDVDTIDSGYIRLERVDAGGEDTDLDVDDLRVSMVGGSLDGRSLVLLNVAAEDLSINTFADLNGFVWVGDNNNDGTDEGPLEIWGTSDGDYVMGLDGNDTIRALGDDDVIDMSISSGGGYGQDSIDGGDGTDLLLFGNTMTSGVNVNLATNTVTGGAAASGATLASIENVSGTAFGDILNGSSVANVLEGLGANDTINGGAGLDTVKGGNGNDNLNGGVGADRLQGDAGNDTLTWQATDFLDGGAGNVDILKILSGNLNMPSTANSRILNIEKIDMTGGGINTLTLNSSEVLTASTTTNTLTVLGNAGDRVNLMGAFALQSTAGGFETWKLGAAIVRIETELTVI